MQYDVIVIGAGSMGMSAGYFLAKSGKKTLLLDSFNPPHSNGSHHGDTRIIRYAYGEGEEYVPFVLKAQELFINLEKTTKNRLFLPTGVLNVGSEKSDFMKNIISSAKKFSLPLDVMNSSEVNKRWPGISLPKDLIGCFGPTSGVLFCEKCIKGYKELAELHGATILANSKVKEIVVNAERVIIKTDEQIFYSEALIISAGAWSGNLLSMLDIHLPLQPVRTTFAWFDAGENLYDYKHFPAFTFKTPQGFYYGFPSIEGSGLKVGRHDGGQKINPDESIQEFGQLKRDKEDLSQFLNQYMPHSQQLKYGETCMYTLTPDENFIIDLHPKYANVAIAAGFSGHGFKFSSVVGQILCELITLGKSKQDISLFSITRPSLL